jgi:hypothetical protein
MITIRPQWLASARAWIALTAVATGCTTAALEGGRDAAAAGGGEGGREVDGGRGVDGGGDVDAGGAGDGGAPPTGTRVIAEVTELVARDVGQGWCSVEYVPTLERFLTIFVNHYSPGGYQDNSLRAFDPVTGEVEYIHPKDVPGAPMDRDNHQMVYNPTHDEMWVFMVGGVVLDVQSAWDNRDVAPSFGAVGWSEDYGNDGFAARAGIVGWPDDFRKSNAVVDWSAEHDTGVIFSGAAYTGQGVRNDLYIIRPHADPSTARYQVGYGGNFDAELAPPDYVEHYIYTTTHHGRHNGRIVGDSLYTLSINDTTAVTYNGDGTYSVQIDLLRFPIAVDTGPVEMERMTPLVYTRSAMPEHASEAMYYPCVTYDSRNNLLLAYLSIEPPNNLWAYLIDLDVWVPVEAEVPASARSLSGCDYSPDHGVHAYVDGNTELEATGWSTITLERLEE